MADVVTLTMNPSIDLSVSVERVLPFHKLRCAEGRRDPGGGGINVARVMKRLGADVTAIYPAGANARPIVAPADRRGGISQHRRCRSAGETREDFTVLERSTGAQYRFVLPGPHVAEREWRVCLDGLAALALAHALYRRQREPAARRSRRLLRPRRAARETGLEARIIIDSSGPALRAAIEAGVYLIKPSLNEFRELTGGDGPLDAEADWIAACRRLVDRGQVEVVALTLGERGALLVTRDQMLRAQALAIKPVSIVGAGIASSEP